MDKAQSARNLFLKESFGVLSTMSVDLPGYPFGSIAPYCGDDRCRPIIYISHIAQHTKNILQDTRVSLTVVERNADSDDVQARGSITCVANVGPVRTDETAVRERYFRYFPSAQRYELTHDFEFFRLELVRVRFIGGFGEIYWVEPDEFTMKNPFSFQQESRIIEHMNNDHADALRRYAGGAPATMGGIDAEGFDLLASGKKLRLEFDTPVHTMDEARQALIAMAKRPA
ncbi:MAG: heme iron utilization protein [Acidobacteria bacterium]|nr:MAG: heme iron utilization protein [Acidobacteriota bacterium]